MLSLVSAVLAFTSSPQCVSRDEYYAEVRTYSCEYHGYLDLLDQAECTRVLKERFYSEVRFEMTITPGNDTPPGCWPVDYERIPPPSPFTKPTACLNVNTASPAACSDIVPCFCKSKTATLCEEDAAIPELPYVRIESSTCKAMGYDDYLDSYECTQVLQDNYYNGMLFTNTITPGTDNAPGCWPVTNSEEPLACINPVTTAAAPVNCSAITPCFCKTA